MPVQPLNRVTADEAQPPPEETTALLSAVGFLTYEWSLVDDTIRWTGDVKDILQVAAVDTIATGSGFAELLDPDSPANRYDAVTHSPGSDAGDGVPYQIEYAIRPAGSDTKARLWIEDCGRWYAGKDGRPALARGVIRAINQRREREQSLNFLATHDVLTGLHNRAHLVYTLDHTIHRAEKFQNSAAFMILAITNFRQINECYGLAVADQVLAAVASNIAPRLRNQDVMGRYGGSKIGLVLHDCDEESMTIAAERFLAAARDEVVTTRAGPVAVAACVGGVVLPRYGRNAHDAMLKAQAALDIARNAGHGRFIAYSHCPEREQQRLANANLANELVSALNARRLHLAYQPIVSVDDRRPVFHEVLLRLRTADGAMLQTAGFMQLGERIGMSRMLDYRALELAIATLAEHPDVHLSINVSGETTAEPQWLAYLSTAARHHPGIAERLIVEITETVAIHNIEATTDFIAALHDLGCRVAIDDFGSGHTSFRNLRRLEVDFLKLDGAFVRDLATSPDDRLFVRTLTELARNFGIATVAEWVEDETSADLLKEWGVDYLQGHLVGKPQLEPDWLKPLSLAAAS